MLVSRVLLSGAPPRLMLLQAPAQAGGVHHQTRKLTEAGLCLVPPLYPRAQKVKQRDRRGKGRPISQTEN